MSINNKTTRATGEMPMWSMQEFPSNTPVSTLEKWLNGGHWAREMYMYNPDTLPFQQKVLVKSSDGNTGLSDEPAGHP